MTDNRLYDRAASLRTAVVPLARQLRQRVDDTMTPTQISVLGAIRRHGPLTLGDLATRERLSSPTISKAIAALEAAGVVERLNDASDRRVCLVRTTAAGLRFIEETRVRRNTWLAERLRTLAPDELDSLATAIPLLERLVEDD